MAKEEVISISDDASEKHSQSAHEIITTKHDRLAPLRAKLAPAMLYVVSMAQFIDIVNGSSMTVALVDISTHLGFDSFSTQWIISSYIVTFGGFLLLFGRVGDMYGHGRVFLVGQLWFGLWSIVISFSNGPAMFCITRALQGIGGAMTIPCALALITTTYAAGPKRTKALAIFAGFGAGGAVLGLLLAGALISSLGWSWIFRLSGIFSFLLFVIGFVTIPTKAPETASSRIDIVGSLTATSSLICILYYISTGSGTGWASVKTLPVLAAGVVLFAVFIWVELRVAKYPIMPFSIWRLKNFSSSFVAILFLQGQFQGFCYFATLIFQNVMGYTSMQTALAFLAHSLFAVFAFTALGKILPKYPLKPFILIGFVLRCVAALMFAFVHSGTNYWTLPFCGLLVHVLGMGTSILPAQITALKDAQNDNQGVVGALYSTGMQLGAPIGLAIVTAISENSVILNDVPGSTDKLMQSYRNGLLGVVGLGVVGFLISVYMIPFTRPTPLVSAPPTAQPEESEMSLPSTIMDVDPVETKVLSS
ncbi:MAG: major facilitator superfamily domain-containing protein [Podila humilis]|nr:MAG: major facilitator superfamily domain-containing protein [Podila humilis]